MAQLSPFVRSTLLLATHDALKDTELPSAIKQQLKLIKYGLMLNASFKHLDNLVERKAA